MIDYTEPREVIESAIEENFTEIPIVFENTANKSENDPHLEIEMYDLDSEFMDMEMKVSLITGIMVIGIFSEYGSGTKVPRGHATSLASIVSGISGMNIESCEFAAVGQVEGFNLYRHNLTMKFKYFYGQDDING